MVESMVTIANHDLTMVQPWLAMVTMVKSIVNHDQPQSSFRRGSHHIPFPYHHQLQACYLWKRNLMQRKVFNVAGLWWMKSDIPYRGGVGVEQGWRRMIGFIIGWYFSALHSIMQYLYSKFFCFVFLEDPVIKNPWLPKPLNGLPQIEKAKSQMHYIFICSLWLSVGKMPLYSDSSEILLEWLSSMQCTARKIDDVCYSEPLQQNWHPVTETVTSNLLRQQEQLLS